MHLVHALAYSWTTPSHSSLGRAVANPFYPSQRRAEVNTSMDRHWPQPHRAPTGGWCFFLFFLFSSASQGCWTPPLGRRRDGVGFPSTQFLSVRTSCPWPRSVTQSSSPDCSAPAAPAPNKGGHSAPAVLGFSATHEYLPLLPALQPREIKCKLSLFLSTDHHLSSPRSQTNTLCTPHFFPAHHLLVS